MVLNVMHRKNSTFQFVFEHSLDFPTHTTANQKDWSSFLEEVLSVSLLFSSWYFQTFTAFTVANIRRKYGKATLFHIL